MDSSGDRFQRTQAPSPCKIRRHPFVFSSGVQHVGKFRALEQCRIKIVHQRCLDERFSIDFQKTVHLQGDLRRLVRIRVLFALLEGQDLCKVVKLRFCLSSARHVQQRSQIELVMQWKRDFLLHLWTIDQEVISDLWLGQLASTYPALVTIVLEVQLVLDNEYDHEETQALVRPFPSLQPIFVGGHVACNSWLEMLPNSMKDLHPSDLPVLSSCVSRYYGGSFRLKTAVFRIHAEEYMAGFTSALKSHILTSSGLWIIA